MELYGKFVFDKRNSTYKFNVNRVITWNKDPELIRIIGDHVGGRNNDDVATLYITNFKVHQIPRNICKFFPNLTTLTINNCSLKTVSKFDFEGLKQLKQLTLNENDLISLPNNLFEETQQIETISMHTNRLEFIGANIFQFLKNLKSINLKSNVNIDARCKSTCGVDFENIKNIINEECQATVIEEIMNTFDYEAMKTFGDLNELLEDYRYLQSDMDIY
jgi:Leucine-rich repeat (LRR) protein